MSSHMSLEDSLVSCESEGLLRSYESDILLHISERKCALCVSSSNPPVHLCSERSRMTHIYHEEFPHNTIFIHNMMKTCDDI